MRREDVLQQVKANALDYILGRYDPIYYKDREIALAAVKQASYVLKLVDPAFLSDKSFMIEAVNPMYDALNFASAELKADPELVLTAIKNGALSLKYAADSLKEDKLFIIEALKINPEIIQFAAPSLKQDPVFIFKLGLINQAVFNYIDKTVKQQVLAIARECSVSTKEITKNAQCLKEFKTSQNPNSFFHKLPEHILIKIAAHTNSAVLIPYSQAKMIAAEELYPNGLTEAEREKVLDDVLNPCK